MYYYECTLLDCSYFFLYYYKTFFFVRKKKKKKRLLQIVEYPLLRHVHLHDNVGETRRLVVTTYKDAKVEEEEFETEEEESRKSGTT